MLRFYAVTVVCTTEIPDCLLPPGILTYDVLWQ